MKAKNIEKIFVLNSVCLSFHFPPYFEEKLENNVATKSASKDYGKFEISFKIQHGLLVKKFSTVDLQV